MRKVTEECCKAFLRGEPLRRDNTEVVVGSEGTVAVSLRLHGNEIARMYRDGTIFISDAGWATNVTKERLNGLLRMLGKDLIYQKDFAWQHKGEDFPSGEWVMVD